MSTEREDFEAWASGQNWVIDRDSFGDYVYGSVRDGWEAYQAGRTAQASPSLPPVQVGAEAEDALQRAQRVGLQLDEDQLYAIENAADLLEGYRKFISDHVTVDDIEMHPYPPAIEGAAEELRTLAASARPKEVTP